jgi:hypothetical protein
MLAPGLLDRYLATSAWDGQQHDGAADPNRPSNLWEPAPGDYGAHGAFDGRATDRSYQLWANTHRPALAAAGVGLAAGLWALLKR